MTAILRDAGSGTWRLFRHPVATLVASSIDEVLPAVERIEAECAAGRFAAGFLSYESAPAFDAALTARPSDGFPLAWFGVYDRVEEKSLDELGADAGPIAEETWTPSISPDQYAEVFDRLQELIRDGDTYQVNFTYRLRARLRSDPFALFLRLAGAQSPPFGAYIDTGDWMVCSASPELFFHRSGTRLESRPMKGTAPRGLWFEQDVERARSLRESAKERAENVMIVDMVRNDLGRIARPGTVRVSNLFDVERYPTVLQMTSTVSGESDAPLAGVLRALFPAASITGAPKARTMEIIAGVECSPRRLYTGAIGFVEPGGRAQFSVAIRTLVVHRATREAEYGIGGGIVADSRRDEEWKETQIKARVLAAPAPSFELLETLLWMPEPGFVLIGRHLKRLLQSADYFGFAVDLAAVREALDRRAAEWSGTPQRVRLRVSKRGAIAIDAAPHDTAAGFADLVPAVTPVDAANPFLYHKTTNRTVYERALAECPGASDVLLYNERGEATESTIANLVVDIGGTLYTPPLASGVLPGTLRGHLLDEGTIRERVITVQEVFSAQACYLINSVRGFHPVTVAYRNVIQRSSL